MIKKYEFTDETKDFQNEGTILHRIKAIRDFGDIKAGDIGGWIEKESNLSHEGTCWVSNEACVLDNARVIENAKILDEAIIYCDAVISGNAEISEQAFIYDEAKVSGNAKIGGDTEVSDTAVVKDDAEIFGCSFIFGDSIISGQPYIVDSWIRSFDIDSDHNLYDFNTDEYESIEEYERIRTNAENGLDEDGNKIDWSNPYGLDPGSWNIPVW